MEKLYYITRTLKVFVLTGQDIERYGYGELPEALKQEIAGWDGGVSTGIVLVTDDNVHALKAESGWNDDSCVYVNRGEEVTLRQALAISKKSVAEQLRLERGVKLGDLVRVHSNDPHEDDLVGYVARVSDSAHVCLVQVRGAETLYELRYEQLEVIGDGYKPGVAVRTTVGGKLGDVVSVHAEFVLCNWRSDGSNYALPYAQLEVISG